LLGNGLERNAKLKPQSPRPDARDATPETRHLRPDT
jgi:hypothetical protein